MSKELRLKKWVIFIHLKNFKWETNNLRLRKTYGSMLHRTYKIQLFQPAALVRVWGRRKG
jgi:hypothetical protein